MAGIGVALEGGDSIRVGNCAKEGLISFPQTHPGVLLTSTLPPHSLAQMVGKDPGGEKASPERQATPLRCCYKRTLTHPSPSDSGPPLVAVATSNFCIRASAGLLLSGSRAPGKPARSPKPFKNESRLAKLQHIHPPTPLASRALPARLTPARSGFPERRPRRPPPSGALPPPSGWRWVGAKAEGCEPLLLPPRRLCGCQIGAGEPSGRRGGRPQPSRRRGPGEGAARAACIARRGPSRRSPLTSANFWGPLGGSERTRARARGSPRPGWASRRLVGAPGHPPPGRGAGQMAGALHCPPALRSKLMLRLNPLAITHDHHRGFYLPV